MRRHVLFSLLILSLAALSHAGQSAEEEVQYLLGFVAESGCTFVRNGREHSAADAADHLALKYSRGRRYVNSAEDFIDRLASASSWSGKVYTVRCGEHTEPSSDWLHRALEAHR